MLPSLFNLNTPSYAFVCLCRFNTSSIVRWMMKLKPESPRCTQNHRWRLFTAYLKPKKFSCAFFTCQALDPLSVLFMLSLFDEIFIFSPKTLCRNEYSLSRRIFGGLKKRRKKKLLLTRNPEWFTRFFFCFSRLCSGNIKKCYQLKCHMENYLSI